MAAPASTSRKEKRKAKRHLRKEQLQKEQVQRSKTARIQKMAVYGISVLLLMGLGYWGYEKWTQQPIGEFVPSLGNRHVTENEVGLITYNSDPPTSGPHLPYVAKWGIHDKPIPKELQVHNLEDGGVLIQYNCSPEAPDCRSLVEALTKIVNRYGHAILAPYPGMSHRIALTAWSRIDKFNDFDEKRIARFIESYIDIDYHSAKR